MRYAVMDAKSMKFVITIISLLYLTACAQMFPAASIELEPGLYRVTSTGNTFAKPSDLDFRIEKKAIKLCGEGNYDYVGLPEAKVGKQKIYTGGGASTTAHYFQRTRLVKCKVNHE